MAAPPFAMKTTSEFSARTLLGTVRMAELLLGFNVSEEPESTELAVTGIAIVSTTGKGSMKTSLRSGNYPDKNYLLWFLLFHSIHLHNRSHDAILILVWKPVHILCKFL